MDTPKTAVARRGLQPGPLEKYFTLAALAFAPIAALALLLNVGAASDQIIAMPDLVSVGLLELCVIAYTTALTMCLVWCRVPAPVTALVTVILLGVQYGFVGMASICTSLYLDMDLTISKLFGAFAVETPYAVSTALMTYITVTWFIRGSNLPRAAILASGMSLLLVLLVAMESYIHPTPCTINF